MAQRPTFPSPYMTAIDATEDNKFCCLINDKDIIKGYTFKVLKFPYEENEEKIVYSTEEAELSKPIYGGNGDDSYLIVEVPANSLENGTEYVWDVSLTDSYGNAVTSKQYYFKCVANPVLTLTSEDITGEKLLKANATFVGTCTCDSGIAYHSFTLTKGKEVLYDSGEKYNQNFTFSYDGFLNGEYTLTFKVKTEDKVSASTELTFQVEYESAPMNLYPVCAVDNEDNSVIVDLSNVVTIPGTYSPTSATYSPIDITDDLVGCYIPENTTLFWQERVGLSDNLDIDENSFVTYLMVNIPYGKRDEIIKLSGDSEILVSFDGYNFNCVYSDGANKTVPITVEASNIVFGNQVATEEINSSNLYEYYFNSDTTYNFTDEYNLVFQTPATANWWLLKITPDKFSAEKGDEVNV